MRGLVRAATGQSVKATSNGVQLPDGPSHPAVTRGGVWNSLRGGGEYGRRRGVKSALATYGGTDQAVKWIFIAASYRAKRAGKYETAFLNTKTLDVVDRPPEDLVAMLARPNPQTSWTRFARAQQLDRDLVGNSYWYLEGQNALGQPERMWRLQPEAVQIVTTDSGQKAGYIYTVNGIKVPYRLDEIMHVRNDNPLDPVYGMGIVEAIMREADLEIGIGEHVVAFFQNGARISGVLTIEGSLPNHVFDRLQEQFATQYGGGANAFKTLIAEKTLDFKPISQPPAALGIKELSDLSKDAILKAFGTPDPLLGGLMENANYKMEEARFNFAEVMEDECALLDDELTVDVASKWGPLTHKTLVVVAEPESTRIARARDSVGTGTSINQLLEIQGQPPSKDKFADEPLLPANIMPMSRVFAPVLANIAPTERSQPTEEDGEDWEGGRKPGEGPATNADESGGTGAKPGTGNADKPPAKSLHDVLAEITKRAATDRVSQIAARYPAAMLPTTTSGTPAAGQGLGPPVDAIGAPGPTVPGPILPGPPTMAIPMPAVVPAKARERDLVSHLEKAATDPTTGPVHPVETLEVPDQLPANVDRHVVERLIEFHAQFILDGVATFQPEFERLLDDQRDRVTARLSAFGRTKRMHGRITGRRDKKELTTIALWPDDQENAFLLAMYEPIRDQLGETAVAFVRGLIGNETMSWTPDNIHARNALEKLARLVTRVNDTTRKQIGSIVDEGLRRGYSIRQIAEGVADEKFKGLNSVFSVNNARAETIARTETAMVYNAASTATYREGLVSAVVVLDGTGWDAECANANGATWSIERAELEPVEHPNCVRAFAPVTSDPAEVDG